MKMIPMFFKRSIAATVLIAASLMLAACGGSTAARSNESSKLTIVTAFYPFAYIAERIAGEHAEVTSLTQPGAEPHDIELTPKQVASVNSASLVLYEKTFQTAVDEAVAQSGNSAVLDTASVVPLQPLVSDSPEEEGLDPHVWLDPKNMITISQAVADRLTSIDPDHATDYASNAASLKGELTALDTAYADGLKTCDRRKFITTHEAFGYLAARYQLTQIGISGLSPDAAPSPTRIAEVQRVAQQHKITTIFYETLISPAQAESIAGDLGLTTDVLDPIEGITDSSRGKDYPAVMSSNLTALVKAGGCS